MAHYDSDELDKIAAFVEMLQTSYPELMERIKNMCIEYDSKISKLSDSCDYILNTVHENDKRITDIRKDFENYKTVQELKCKYEHDLLTQNNSKNRYERGEKSNTDQNDSADNKHGFKFNNLFDHIIKITMLIVGVIIFIVTGTNPY